MQKLFLFLLGCILVLFTGYAGYLGYTKAKEARLVNLARHFMSNSDPTNAALSLKEVLSIDPENVEASRLMADLAEANEEPSELQWRKRVVELSPHTPSDGISLAIAAVEAGDLTLANSSLESVSSSSRNTAIYQNTAGILAIAAHDPALAETAFRNAARYDPQSIQPELNYAVLNLHSTNLDSVREAQALLTKFSQSPTPAIRCAALRELAADAFVHGQTQNAVTFTERLVAETNSTFSDRIALLQLLKAANSAKLADHVIAAQDSARGDPVREIELANWEIRTLSPKQALDWMLTLPAEARTNQPVLLLTAECRSFLGDWRGLKTSLDNQAWGKLEFLRYAFVAQALRHEKLPEQSSAEWNNACQCAGGSIKNVTVLCNLARQWGWPREEKDLLWDIVRNHPQEKWAPEILTKQLIEEGSTESLERLFEFELDRNPDNLQAKNNLAMIALLRGTKEQRPFDLAREAYSADPGNASYASTYALSLYLSHRQQDALKVFNQLSPNDLKAPEIAGYYGLVLQATGNTGEAGAYLKLAGRAPLLPEERRLFALARE